MANFYSNFYVPNGATESVSGFNPRGGRGNEGKYNIPQRMAFGQVRVDTDVAENDVIRMFSLPSWCRLIDLWFASDTADQNYDAGLYHSVPQHSGPVVSTNSYDMFVTANALNASNWAIKSWQESTTLGIQDRGKYLWEQVNVADASTFSVDPRQVWDVCLTIRGGAATTTSDITGLAWYLLE